jgi:DnaJ-class molecular chaperone
MSGAAAEAAAAAAAADSPEALLEVLKQKYCSPAGGESAAPAHEGLVAKSSSSPLDKYLACTVCGGSGISKVEYNFMVLEQNCEGCSGEGLLVKGVDTILTKK